MAVNQDRKTVEGFGYEWAHFDQTALSDGELRSLFDRYFRIFPWEALPREAIGFDLGCGSGRWAKIVSEHVGRLHCIDASADALHVARRNLAGRANCEFHLSDVSQIPLPEEFRFKRCSLVPVWSRFASAIPFPTGVRFGEEKEPA